MNQISKADFALESIRKDICIKYHSGEVTLHEVALAEQFGMSRTPIRQILQRLSFERLVTTKSGVGTIVTPLIEAERESHFQVHDGLLKAILVQDLRQLSVSEHADLMALSALASSIDGDETELHFEVFNKLHKLTAGLIDDPILRDSYSASFWRTLRWRLRDLHNDPAKAQSDSKKMIESVADYKDRQGSDLFAKLLDR